MAEDKIFQVSEFNAFINSYLGQVGEVAIEGEISEASVSQNKWLNITIKDKDSSVRVFSLTFKISGYDLLEPGMLVHVYGIPRLYQKTGQFSVFANQIIPAGEGALKLAFEKLKAKFEREGLFDQARKRALPSFPENIGLITAKGSNAYGDFVKVLKHRMGGLKIFFYPVAVQGRDSVLSILQAFEYFNTNRPELDLLVLTRGGGSLEDLQSFNDERVARAIFSSKIPVVCGIGHEGNVSIADLVADLRASTPSNTAELIVRDRKEVLKDVLLHLHTVETHFRNLIKEKNHIILKNVNILKNSIARELSQLHSVIGSFRMQFAVFIKEVTASMYSANHLRLRLMRAVEYWIGQHQASLKSLIRLLKSLDFRQVLKRGYSITFDEHGAILKSAKSLKKGSGIKTTLHDGKIRSEVLNINLE